MKAFSIACLVIILAGCGKQETTTQAENAVTGSFQLVADEVLRPAVDSLVTGFMLENPNARVTVTYTSATEAVRELLNHQARAILIDRNLSPIEDSLLHEDSVKETTAQWQPLEKIKLAWDGVGVIVSQKNPLTAIAKSDLARIFHGTLSKEADLSKRGFEGGPGPAGTGVITIALPAYPSSIEYALDSILLGRGAQTSATSVVRFGTSDSVIAYVRDHPNAIGFIGSAWDNMLTARGDTSVKTLPVMPVDLSSQGVNEPVLLNMAYIAERIYPLVTQANGYSFEAPNTLPRGFLAYASTAHGQIVFKNFHVLPITQPIKIIRQ